MSNPEQEIQHIKDCIATVYARRERLKLALETGAVAPRAGFAQLEETDRELSGLDSRFKQLWDAAHPAANWARRTVFEPIHLDCVTAIMLKILDAKCKMGAPEKTALTAVYDVIKDRPGQSLDDAVHGLIASARLGADADLAERIHAWRERAEAHIPKPVMKGFKQILRASLPMQRTEEE
ncbi:MAG: hypothetical protein B7Y41_04960 [Hydrogenophilales bacterium 28-61-23]|nr:MAG: hypothetical protein B7Y41_04960 [Hydrogenophilales bacterium 28-61-23]